MEAYVASAGVLYYMRNDSILGRVNPLKAHPATAILPVDNRAERRTG